MREQAKELELQRACDRLARHEAELAGVRGKENELQVSVIISVCSQAMLITMKMPMCPWTNLQHAILCFQCVG